MPKRRSTKSRCTPTSGLLGAGRVRAAAATVDPPGRRQPDANGASANGASANGASAETAIVTATAKAGEGGRARMRGARAYPPAARVGNTWKLWPTPGSRGNIAALPGGLVRRIVPCLLLLVGGFGCAGPQGAGPVSGPGPATSVQRVTDGVLVRFNDALLKLEICAADVVRVAYARNEAC